MGLLDRFKKQKPSEKKELTKKPQLKVEPKVKIQKPKEEKPKTEKPKATRKIVKKEFSAAGRVVEAPVITEKASTLNEFGQYVFRVKDNANKSEIKKAIQDLYGVPVSEVNIVKMPAKKRRLGRHEGWRPGYKKAIVKLAEGEKIEIISR